LSGILHDLFQLLKLGLPSGQFLAAQRRLGFYGIEQAAQGR